MKTEIHRTFSWGFVLSEQELRRIAQTATEHILKTTAQIDVDFTACAHLSNGATTESSSIDDLVALENDGSKAIESVRLEWKCKSAPERFHVLLIFQNAAKNRKNWDSISLSIESDSRDWAFVASSELEERIKRTKIMAWDAILNGKWSTLALLLFSTITMLTIMSFFGTGRDSHILLQEQYQAGKLKNAIEAIIALERIKNQQSLANLLTPMVLAMIAPYLLFFLFGKLSPWLAPSYNFCWGDYVARFDRKRQIRNFVLSAIFLALLISIVANFVSKKLGI
ncbi:hypothetical protein [Chromobacterium aquaticum]|uniref:Type II secretion system protein GspF domain-containing protein n=1 Tax=Chromobacterium aquaticum TaxID=467180 RepID=A0ABV8ZZ09_9NEIS|nr:hypothetical protein [Chromobacterium aquaticum]MCD5360310.1 hypothetical protein [Chromobacterium aquaticum]